MNRNLKLSLRWKTGNNWRWQDSTGAIQLEREVTRRRRVADRRWVRKNTYSAWVHNHFIGKFPDRDKALKAIHDHCASPE